MSEHFDQHQCQQINAIENEKRMKKSKNILLLLDEKVQLILFTDM